MKLVKMIVAATMLLSAVASATEVLVWDKKPLSIRLEVGKERIIEFPDNIELEMPKKAFNRLKIDAAAGVAYMTARAPFPSVRVRAKLVSTNETIFVDLFAVRPESGEDVPLEQVKIVTAKQHEKKQEAKDELFERSSEVSIKELIQYAAHDFFAPDRLKKTKMPIVSGRLARQLDLSLMFTGRSAGLLELKPIKQYQTRKYTLTAIQATNRTGKPQKIVYRDIYPGYEAVSSQHIDVGPRGSRSQSTVIYLVTEKPLTENPVYAG